MSERARERARERERSFGRSAKRGIRQPVETKMVGNFHEMWSKDLLVDSQTQRASYMYVLLEPENKNLRVSCNACFMA